MSFKMFYPTKAAPSALFISQFDALLAGSSAKKYYPILVTALTDPRELLQYQIAAASVTLTIALNLSLDERDSLYEFVDASSGGQFEYETGLDADAGSTGSTHKGKFLSYNFDEQYVSLDRVTMTLMIRRTVTPT